MEVNDAEWDDIEISSVHINEEVKLLLKGNELLLRSYVCVATLTVSCK